MTNHLTGPEPADHEHDNPATSNDEQDVLDVSGLFCCDFCVGGYAPAGTHPLIGLVYQLCPVCETTCRCCNGTARFAADTDCTQCLADAYAVYGLQVVFCHSCAGVLNVHPFGVTL